MMTNDNQTAFYTVGHSNLDLDDFLALLESAAITLVADVRRLPGSTRYPQYNQDALADTLQRVGIQYEHFPDLAGRRKKQGVDAAINGGWNNLSFHHYADYALGLAFANALTRLIQFSATHTVAIMCAEAVWWRCHRRIIADHLIAAGYPVRHIVGAKIEDAQLTSFAKIGPARQVTYPSSD